MHAVVLLGPLVWVPVERILSDLNDFPVRSNRLEVTLYSPLYRLRKQSGIRNDVSCTEVDVENLLRR